MKSCFCQQCGARLFFENTRCLACGSALGFLPEALVLSALVFEGDTWRALASEAGDRRYRQCRNQVEHDVCNWLTPVDSASPYCAACQLNRTVPDLSRPDHRFLWSKMEAAKRRLIYSLLRLGLPVTPRSVDPERGLAFDFLADPDPSFSEEERVMTGHADGLVTINLAEADDAVREKMRLDMREVYRTLLGHFRHEIGHYYWNLLIGGDDGIDDVRRVFGDERVDYADALQAHYANGAPPDWHERFVTPYAAAHPWEDWAETWAHYLHIMDTMETASVQGMEIRERDVKRYLRDPFTQEFSNILEDWHALRFVLNSLNRSMGMRDPYPFVITAAVAAKLAFIDGWIRSRFSSPVN